MNAKRRGLDQDTIIICGLVALAAAVGIIIIPMLVLGIDVLDCNSTMLVTIYAILSGGIWVILLFRNC